MRFLVVALGLAASLAADVNGAYAEKIYKYKSENGTILFTNKSDAKGELVSVAQAEAYEPKNRVTINKSGSSYDFTVSAYNEYYGPAEIYVRLDKNDNYSSDFSFPRSFIMNSREKRDLFRMWVTDRRKSSVNTYSTTTVAGNPRAIHNDSILYSLPISPNDIGQVFISQAFNGQITHTHVQSAHAIDIPAPEGTNIRAARSGVVMDVANDYFRSGNTNKYLDRANFVRILHDDGTMGLYAHLKLESIQVNMGDRVSPGQVIAKVGSTGFSAGPHLHFVVQKNFGQELKSVPFRLLASNGEGVTPEEGMTFR